MDEKEKERKNKDKTNLVTRVADDETFVSDSWTSICLFIFYLSCPFLSMVCWILGTVLKLEEI